MKKKLLHLFPLRVLALVMVLLCPGAATWAQNITFDFEDDGAHRTSGDNSYTGTNTYTENGINISLYYADAVTTSNPISGKANITTRVLKNTTNSPTVTLGPISNTGYKVTGISYKVKGSTTTTYIQVHSSANGTNWTSRQSSEQLTNSATTKSISNLSITDAQVYIKFTVSVNNSTGSNRDVQIDDIVISRESRAPAAPTFSTAEGNFSEAFSLELSCATEGASIYYTTDGSTPSSSSAQYNSTDKVSIPAATTTVKAIAILEGMSSEVATATYTYKNPALTDPTFTITTPTMDIKVGEEGQKILWTTNSDGAISFESSDDESLTVGNDGSLYAIAAGVYTVTVKLAETGTYSSAQDQVTVNVTKYATSVIIEDALLTNKDVYLQDPDDLGALVATVKRGEETLNTATVEWTSSMPSVATIDAQGMVNLLAAGTTTIKATYAGSDENEGAEAQYVLVVTNSKPQATSIEVTTNYVWLGTEKNNGLTAATDPKTIDCDGVTATISKASGGTYPRGDENYIRWYAKNTLKLEAPTGYNITKVVFTASTWNNGLTVDNGSWNNTSKTWTGEASAVTFTVDGSSGNNQPSKIAITLEKQLLAAGLAFSTSELTITDLDDYTLPTLTKTTTAEVAYSIEDNDAVLVDEKDGSLVVEGNAQGLNVTATTAENATYKAGTASYTLNVSLTDPALSFGQESQRVHLADGATLPALSKAGGLDDSRISYSSSNTAVATLSGSTLTLTGEGTTTITATVAIGGKFLGGTTSYKLIVAGNNPLDAGLMFDEETLSVDYAAGQTLTNEFIQDTDATPTFTSSQEGVATVAADGTVTILATGTTTITATTPANEFYQAGQASYTLTVNAPTGKETAPEGGEETTLLNEDFSLCKLSGGRDGSYNGNVSSTQVTSTHLTSGQPWNTTTTSTYACSSCVKVGKASAAGSIATNAINVGGTKAILTFEAAGWSKANTTYTGTVTVTNGKIEGLEENQTSYSFVPTQGQFDSFSLTITDITGDITITFGGYCYFLDNVKLVRPAVVPSETVHLNASGYATYCSVNPLDFSGAEDYTAWYVSAVDDESGTVNFEPVTGDIKGGQGILLWSKTLTDPDIEVKLKNSQNILTNNQLVGTTAPTFIEQAGDIYGLSGDKFVKNSKAGSIRANRAYLPASVLTDDGGNVRQLTFVFRDPTTGVSETRRIDAREAATLFDLGGRRLQKPRRGLNIVGGKKVVVK